MSTKEAILRQALCLGREDRAELVMQLIASLEGRGDDDAEGQWLRQLRPSAAEAAGGDSGRERVTPLF